MLSIEAKNRINDIVCSKAIVANRRGDVKIDGVLVSETEKQALSLFEEGVDRDIEKHGPIGAVLIYKKASRENGRLGRCIQTSIKLQRMLDQEDISKR
jgi:hypothetical protein